MTPPTPRAGLFATGLRYGLIATAAVTGLSVLVGLGLEPLHARGNLQFLTGYLNGLDHLLQIFGMKAAAVAGLIQDHHLTAEGWYFSRGVSALLWFAAGCYVGMRLWFRARAVRPNRDGTAQLPVPSAGRAGTGACLRHQSRVPVRIA